eukprot:scaffold54866_cov60-Attheya_sp.AAC.3
MGKVVCRVRHWRQDTATAHGRLLICRCNPNGGRHVVYTVYFTKDFTVSSRTIREFKRQTLVPLTPFLYLFKRICLFL